MIDANFQSSLEKRWQLIPLHDLQQLSSFSFELFLYVNNEALPTFHRATATRLENARLQRLAYQAANDVSFGEISAQHLDVVHARQPDGSPFTVPCDNTTHQSLHLEFSDSWMSMEVDILSLRRALGLPDHNIFSRGIYHSFQEVQPSNPDMDDIDHADDDDL